MNQFDWPEGATWRVFGIDAYPDGPVKIVRVAEVRQQNPPSTWSVHVTNHALMPVNSLTLAAAVVDIKGEVKATQPLAAIKNLRVFSVRRARASCRARARCPSAIP